MFKRVKFYIGQTCVKKWKLRSFKLNAKDITDVKGNLYVCVKAYNDKNTYLLKEINVTDIMGDKRYE